LKTPLFTFTCPTGTRHIQLDAGGGPSVVSADTGWAIVAPNAAKIEAVSKVSTAQKLGVVARVARRQAKGSRTVRAVTSAVKTTGRAIGRVLHQLWLEVTGLVFLIMAASGGVAAAHEYAKYHAGGAGFGRVALALCFTATFAWFGVSSFWRVWRKTRSGGR
jgi:hypothetical protein